MASPAAESAPLLPPDISSPFSTSSSSNPSPLSGAPSSRPGRSQRTVTFNANPVSKTIEPDPLPDSDSDRGTANTAQRRTRSLYPHHSPTMASSSAASSTASSSGRTPAIGGATAGGTGPQMLSSLNNKLRRRNSHGNAATGTAGLPLTTAAAAAAAASFAGPKIGPQRSTKNAQKLKLLPNTDPVADDEPPLKGAESEEDGHGTPARDVYSQYTRIQDPAARRDAARLGKADRERLPRVTAYCTANKYQVDGLMRFLKGRGRTRGANPKLIDECIYTPYRYGGGGGGSSSGGGGVEDRARSQKSQSTQNESPRAPARPATPVTAYARRHSAGEFMDGSERAFRTDGDLIDLETETGEEVRRDRWEPGESSVTLAEDSNNSNNNHGFPPGDPIALLLPPSLTSSVGMGVVGGGASGDGVGGHNESAIATVEDEPLAGSNGKVYSPTDSAAPTAAAAAAAAEFDVDVHTPEVFLFDYGVVVIWGMSAANEQRFLKELAKFEEEKLAPDDVEAEFFNFYYTHEYQARIYNDFITLRDKNNYMTKLAISHALAQSVKTSLFEELIASTVDTCKDIPTQIALTGKIALSRTQINMQIGELFILRINIHLNGSVLDTPELFWVEPQLEPVYQAVRSYLEMDQRVGLLTGRLDVIADLLAVLKDQLSHGHGEKLEWIVIVLIAAEILVAIINIFVDLYAGV